MATYVHAKHSSPLFIPTTTMSYNLISNTTPSTDIYHTPKSLWKSGFSYYTTTHSGSESSASQQQNANTQSDSSQNSSNENKKEESKPADALTTPASEEKLKSPTKVAKRPVSPKGISKQHKTEKLKQSSPRKETSSSGCLNVVSWRERVLPGIQEGTHVMTMASIYVKAQSEAAQGRPALLNYLLKNINRIYIDSQVYSRIIKLFFECNSELEFRQKCNALVDEVATEIVKSL